VVPGLAVAAAVFASLAALGMITGHARRALGSPRAPLELLALGAYIFAAERVAGPLGRHFTGAAPALGACAFAAASAAAGLAALALAGRLWWLSPVGRSLSAALLAAAVEAGTAPQGAALGLWEWRDGGAFLGVPVGALLLRGGLLMAWSSGSDLFDRTDRHALWPRAAVAAAALLAVPALAAGWSALHLESRLGMRGAWAVWAFLWAMPALLALTGRAAVLPESLAGLLAATPGLAPVLAPAVLLATALAGAAAGDDPLPAIAAGGALLPMLGLLPTNPALDTWRLRAFSRLGQVQDLVRVLMKPRNGAPWTPEDKAFLRAGLRALARWTPGFVLFLLPGGFVLLGIYAWLLDRRRLRAEEAAARAGRRDADPPARLSGTAS